MSGGLVLRSGRGFRLFVDSYRSRVERWVSSTYLFAFHVKGDATVFLALFAGGSRSPTVRSEAPGPGHDCIPGLHRFAAAQLDPRAPWAPVGSRLSRNANEELPRNSLCVFVPFVFFVLN